MSSGYNKNKYSHSNKTITKTFDFVKKINIRDYGNFEKKYFGDYILHINNDSFFIPKHHIDTEKHQFLCHMNFIYTSRKENNLMRHRLMMFFYE